MRRAMSDVDNVTRIGVSLDPDLLEKFDISIEKKGYVTRSEAFRDLIRESLAESEWKNDDEYMTGVIVYVFDFTNTDIMKKIGNLQNKSGKCIISSTRIPLDGNKAMEVIALDGTLKELKDFTNELLSLKGILRGKLTMANPKNGNLHHIGSNH